MIEQVKKHLGIINDVFQKECLNLGDIMIWPKSKNILLRMTITKRVSLQT